MSDPEALVGDVVDDGPNLPATRPMPGPPASAGAGLTATLANLPAGTAKAVVAHSAETARELRAVIDGVRGPDGKPTLVALIRSKDGKTSEHVTAEGWAMLGAMVGVGVRIDQQRTVDYSHPVHRPRAVGWESLAVAFDRASGEDLAAEWGMCLRDEPRWASAAEYAVRGMSATRARGRALKAVLGYVMRLAGYDPSPAEEREGAGDVEGAPDAFPDGAQRPTAAQIRAIDERLATLDLDRAADVPVDPVSGRPFEDWRAYLDAFLARRLRGRGIAGLTRPEAVRARERLEDLIAGGVPEPVEPAARPAPGAPSAAAGSGGPAAAPAPTPASSAEGRIRARQIRREAEDRGLDDGALAALLAPLGVRVDELAADLAADGDRYRRALEAVRNAQRPSTVENARSGPDASAAPESAGGAARAPDSAESDGSAPQDGAQSAAGSREPGSGADAPPPDPEAGASDPPASGGECPACGEAVEAEGLCAECAAMGLGS